MTARPRKKSTFQPPRRRARGFARTGGILQGPIRKATEKRGFVETRLLTHWAEIVGQAMAAITKPVKVGYGQQGLGATLTILTNGANAPMVQAELPKLQDRVNACYGYAAIARIRITQTSATGFAETQQSFSGQPQKSAVTPEQIEQVAQSVQDLQDDTLRHALETLGQNIVTRTKH